MITDFIKLGYGTSFLADIIKISKELMIKKGHSYYESRKLERVPCEAVEEILGINFLDENRSDWFCTVRSKNYC